MALKEDKTLGWDDTSSYLGCGPLTVTVVNEGLVRDSLLKIFKNVMSSWWSRLHPVGGATPKSYQGQLY